MNTFCNILLNTVSTAQGITTVFAIAVIVLVFVYLKGNSAYVDKKKITREYYKKITAPLDKIYDLYLSLYNNRTFLASYPSRVYLSITDSSLKELSPRDKLMYLFLVDIVTCYKAMGLSVDVVKKEGFGLLYCSAKFLKKKISYYNLSSLNDQFVTTIIDFLGPLNGSMNSMSFSGEELLMSRALEDYDVNLQKQYISLIYNFSTITAKADVNVTAKEQQWLNSLKSFYSKKNATNKNVKTTIGGNSLNNLIGLKNVKQEIGQMSDFIKVQQERQAKGLPRTPLSYHCVFTGNPGTGKTTVARCLAEIYHSLGILSKGHLVETDRSGLVAEYVGQTAVKTNNIIDSALDGVLFIDEAYTLVNGSSNDFGHEAIATLLKRMEDDRERLVVVLAGYTEEMKHFINSNPGLQSRFNRYIEFPDYNERELYQIFQKQLTDYRYVLDKSAEVSLKQHFNRVVANKDEKFGNARYVRNLFEKTLERQASRLASASSLSKVDYSEIKQEDLAI